MAGDYQQKMLRVVVLGTFIHFMLFVAVMDIYFASPIEKGMTTYKNQRPVPVKRVVLMVADGLRAESLYESNEGKTPYLMNIRKHRGSWGVSHTRVPTESRPGHVAMMAGIYEDPSAIFKGWKANPVDFDSIFNESANTWAWGSPDIVTMFNKENKSYIHTDFYDPDEEDFGENDTFLVDTWVFNKVESFLKNVSKIFSDCKEVCESGNLFFLHLLGTDLAGHSHKPNSKQLLKNMEVVDEGVKKIEDLFTSTFKDNATAFVFTADHGMTDWGAHGDGSNHETETPLILWGAGFKVSPTSVDINQADITPLVSSLLGNNIPINSVGVLPHQVLNFNQDSLAGALIANAKQLVAQYEMKSGKLKKTTIPLLYTPYEHDKEFKDMIKKLDEKFEKGLYDEVIDQAQVIMHLAKHGIRYVQVYHRTPLLIFISSGFIFWLIYLGAVIAEGIEREETLYPRKPVIAHNIKVVIKLTIILTFLVTSIFINMQALSSKIYLYALFPIFMLYLLATELETFISMIYLIGNFGWGNFAKQALIYLAGIEIVAVGFFYRELLLLLMISISVWLYNTQFSTNRKLIWFGSLTLLGLFPYFPTLTTSFNYTVVVFVAVCWIYLYYYQFRRIQHQYLELHTVDKIIYNVIIHVQLVLFVIASINTLIIAIYFDTGKEMSVVFHIISWLIFVLSLAILPLSPTNLVIRVSHIFSCMMGIYILFCNYLEGPFIIVLMIALLQWVYYEYKLKPQSKDISIFYYDFTRKTKDVIKDSSADFRKSMFLLSFIIISFFGTGNTASISSFNPMWVRCFLTVFSPFTMFALILMKITIPFLLVICAFRAISLFSGQNIMNVFYIVLLYCDIIVVQFMFVIRDEGSWREIGTQISVFVVVELVTVVTIAYYFVAYWLTTNTWYNPFVQYITHKIAKKATQ